MQDEMELNAKGERETKVLILKSGGQIVTNAPSGVSMSVVIPGDPVAREQYVEVNSDQLIELERLAVTNEISDVMLRDIEKKITE